MDTNQLVTKKITDISNNVKSCLEFIENLKIWQDLLSELPEESDNFYTSISLNQTSLYIHYYPNSNEEAETIRSQVQLATNLIAKREGLQTGQPYYSFENHKNSNKRISIRINKAKLAQGCKLITKTKEVEYFEVVCETN